MDHIMGILFGIYIIGLLSIATFIFKNKLPKPPKTVQIAGYIEVIFGTAVFLFSYMYVIDGFRWTEYYFFSLIGVIWIAISYFLFISSRVIE